MPVSDIGDSKGLLAVGSIRQKDAQAGFSEILNKAATATDEGSTGPGNVESHEQEKSGQVALREIGRISKETPTVSHILKKHPEYFDRCWDIIHSPVNNGKKFRQMREGTVVVLKPDSNELLWGKELLALTDKINTAPDDSPMNTAHETGPVERPIVIGTISTASPTVSHLFQAHPDFDNSFWDIINSPVNISKEYTSLRPGTLVSLDPRTMELSFMNASQVKTAAQEETKTVPVQLSLADAVKPYIGTSYKEIDCYGLIVRGLTTQGVKYWGQGGIKEKLENLAMRDGLPRNAYLNGEGLVEKAGKKLFSKFLPRISNTNENAEQVYSELAPYLQKGLILSFSTPTRGHTGVVSRQGKEWTYINSGLIDNQISPGRVSERVGEERLKAEINQWFAFASERNEPITVTLGQVDEG
ncbi:MAG: hypothetical protein JSU90_01550 [Nitrospiraceae bacterium]|nr:MAG: hypothetical protein JSU90_01550 [Nitrospiraceae bacterium]